MSIDRVALLLFGASVAAGFAIAYLGVAAGVLGYLSANAVSFYALVGGSVAFVAAAAYFLTADRIIRRRFNSVK